MGSTDSDMFEIFYTQNSNSSKFKYLGGNGLGFMVDVLMNWYLK